MSLANAGIGGNVGMSTQAFNVNMPAPIASTHAPGTGGSGCNDGCCGPSGPDLSMMAAATNKTGNFRGEISGSQCLSIDLGEDKMAAAVWSEKDFSVTVLREAINTAICITREGNNEVLDFLDSPSGSKFESIKGLSFGSSSESKKNNGCDILHPTRFLGQEKSPLTSSLLDVLKDPTSTFSKTQALRLPLTNSSSGEAVSLHPEELVALQLQYWASKARAKQGDDKKGSSDGKKKKKQKSDKGVTLVVPGYYGQRERNVAKAAASVAGLDLRHVFSRGLCATAAALMGPQASAVHTALKCCSNNEKNPIALFVHVNSHGVDVSVIECELPIQQATGDSARSGSNAMYYDRLVCLAAGGCGGDLEGVSGASVMKHASGKHLHVHAHGKGDCCGGHGHGELKGERVKDKSSKKAAALHVDYSPEVASLVGRVVTQQLQLANLTASDVSLVLHSGRGSPASLHECFNTESALDALKNVSLAAVPDEDPARGGSILTAAELDSSKQYIEIEEDHSILVHSLPIAEDVMSTSVGMLYVESEDMEQSFGNDNSKVENSIQCIYPAGTVIRKADVGPVRKQVTLPSIEPKEFFDGVVNFFGSHNASYQNPAYPKLLLVQLEPSLATISNVDNAGVYRWRPVTDIGFPLLIDNGRSLLKAMRKASKEGKEGSPVKKSSQRKQALLSCKINFKVNESHGLLTLEHAQGHKVTERIKAKSQVAKIAYTIAFICFLIVAYYGYGIYCESENHRQDVIWLTDFYERHAPQKLEDANLVEDTLARYKDKLFVLWRKLEKAYDVKFPPPQRIVDSNEL